jgi:Arc/MetJ family transcription regulator
MFRALAASPAAGEIESLVTGALMRRYSKAPEHAYDAALRREVLLEAGREHAAEIARGMHWLHQLASRHPPLEWLFAGPQLL